MLSLLGNIQNQLFVVCQIFEMLHLDDVFPALNPPYCVATIPVLMLFVRCDPAAGYFRQMDAQKDE
jgi:hypothetical protein